MGFVTRETGLGLTLVESHGSEAQLQLALKRIDDRLVLQKHPGNVEGGYVYKVFKIVSEDRPAEAVCTWCDEYGRPLPLSSGLLSRVESLRMGARGTGPDADEHNARLTAEREKTAQDARDAVMDMHRAKLERGQTTVAFGSGTGKRYWQRNLDGPKGAAA